MRILFTTLLLCLCLVAPAAANTIYVPQLINSGPAALPVATYLDLPDSDSMTSITCINAGPLMTDILIMYGDVAEDLAVNVQPGRAVAFAAGRQIPAGETRTTRVGSYPSGIACVHMSVKDYQVTAVGAQK